jgi:hypothetical protein
MTDHDRAFRFYGRLLALYPKPHRDEFGPQMQRAFEDSYRHATGGERRPGVEFWLAVLLDQGRSIVREQAAQPQGDVVFFAMVLIWALGVMIVPVGLAVNDWHHLVLPAAGFAILLLTIPGTSGLARRIVTVLLGLAVFECMYVAAQSLKDENDLLAPALLVACMAFSIKTLTGLNARMAGIGEGVWGREELTYGALAGIAGVVALAFGVADTSDNPLPGSLLFYFVVPFLCAIAGFRTSRRHFSARAGIYAAMGSMLVAATIWILARPLVVVVALQTVLRDHPVPAAMLLPFWQRPMSSILFWAAMIGLAGAYFGYLASESGSASQSPSGRPEG